MAKADESNTNTNEPIRKANMTKVLSKFLAPIIMQVMPNFEAQHFHGS